MSGFDYTAPPPRISPSVRVRPYRRPRVRLHRLPEDFVINLRLVLQERDALMERVAGDGARP